jgi:hypothetical protein
MLMFITGLQIASPAALTASGSFSSIRPSGLPGFALLALFDFSSGSFSQLFALLI